MHIASPNRLRLVVALTGAILAAFVFYSTIALADVSSGILPTADGNYTQWTPSTGTSHYALVDETACNGLTDYNSTTVVGNRDSYSVSLTSVPAGATITQIDIVPCASRVSSGGANSVMKVFYRANGVNSADAGSYSLSGTTPTQLATTSYSSLSIVRGSTTTLEVGAVLTSSTKGARLSRIATTLTYTPLTAPTTLSGSATTSSAVQLSWTDTSSNETGFTIERSLDGSVWSGIATTSANVTSYFDTGLSAATTYYHRVRAYNAGAYTAYTNTATTTTTDVSPTAPSSLSDTAVSSSQIDLAWTDNSSNETGFTVERSLNGATWSAVATTTAGVTSYSDTGLSTATHYFHRVRAYNAVGYSSYSNTADATTTDVAPNAPTGANATASGSVMSINVTWTDSSSNETAFEVLRSTDNVVFTHLATTSANATSYNNTGLASSTTYYYQVRAYNTIGYSDVSNTASATTGDAPAVATDVTATASTTALSIDITWTDNATNETSYVVQQSFMATSSFTTIATKGANSTLHTYTPTVPNLTYYFRILAVNGYGTTTSSSAFAVSASLPSAPTSLSLATSTIGMSTSTRITLTWTDNASNETAYKIERKNITGSFAQIATTSANIVSFDDDTTSPGTWTYRVRAFNGVGNSSYSNSATTTYSF